MSARLVAGILILIAGLLYSWEVGAAHPCTDQMMSINEPGRKWVQCGHRQNNSHCIMESWECDGTRDCEDGSDETYCDTTDSLRYRYTGDVFFPNQQDGLYIDTVVLLQVEKQSKRSIYTMKLENPKLSRSKNQAKNLLSDGEIGVWEETIKFEVLQSGAISNIYTSSASYPADVLNIKKSIISLFQFKLKHKKMEYENLETDPTGTCHVKYRITNQTMKLTYGGQHETNLAVHKFNVTKTNDYTNCQNRVLYTFTNMKPVDCTKDHELQFPESNVRTSCIIYHREKESKHFLHSCISRGSYRVKTGAKDTKNTPFVANTESRLTFIGMDSPKKVSGNYMSKSSITFSFDGLTKPSKKELKDDLNEIKGILISLSDLASEEGVAWKLLDHVVPKIYLHLVIHMRWRTKPSTLERIYSSYFDKPKYRIWLESALPFLGTGAAGAVITRLIETGKINGTNTIKLLTRLGTVAEPEKELCDHVMKLCKSSRIKGGPASAPCWLAFGSLVYSYCDSQSSCPMHFIKFLSEKFNQNHMEDNEKLVVALKAIGNAGQTQHLPLVLKTMNTSHHHRNAVVTAAIDALRLMPLQGDGLLKAQTALLNLFRQRSTGPEVRLVAFSALIRTGPTPSMLFALAGVIRYELSPTVKHYVYSYLGSESKATCPDKKSYTASVNLLGRLANAPHEEFDPRFSFSKSVLTDFPGQFKLFKVLLNIEAVSTPASIVPRFLKIKNTMKLKGLDIDHHEFKLRQNSIFSLFRDLFGPHGSVYQKKSLMDFIRLKRASDDKGFPSIYRRMQEMIAPTPKTDSPLELSLSAKLFRSEIMYMVLNESNPVIESLVKDGTIKVQKDWWNNVLQAGMNLEMKANDLLQNSMIIVPTAMGLPLHLRSSMAGVLALSGHAKVQSYPMLNLLPWNKKPKNVTGNFKACFSVSTYSNSRMYWFYRNTRMGYETHYSLSMRCPAPLDKITFKAEPQAQKLNVRMAFLKGKYVYSNTSMYAERFARIQGQEDYRTNIILPTPSKPAAGLNPGVPFKPGQMPYNSTEVDQGPEGGVAWSASSSTENKNGLRVSLASYSPGKNVITDAEIIFKNVTQSNDKQGRFDIQVLLDGEGKQRMAKYHLDLNVTKDTGFLVKVSHIKNGTIIQSGCLRTSLDAPNQRLDVGFGWGNGTCNPSMISETIIYSGTTNNPRIDIYTRWSGLPANLEMYTCPKKYVLKQMEELRKQGLNAGSGAQGQMKQGVHPASGQGGRLTGNNKPSIGGVPPASNQGVFPFSGFLPGFTGGIPPKSGQGGGPFPGFTGINKLPIGGVPSGSGQGGGPFPGFTGNNKLPIGGVPSGSGQGGGPFAGFNALPCFRSMNLSLAIKNGKQFIVSGFPMPQTEILNTELPFNATKVIAMVRNGIKATCTVKRSTDEFTTFDKHSFTYSQSKGCPHVLAKDCSKKELFAVFVTKNNNNEKEVNIVVKDTKGRGHSFVVEPDLTVEHDGSILKLKKGKSNSEYAEIPHVCNVIKSSRSLTIKCAVGLTVEMDMDKISVDVTPWYFGYMCGLCGNYNWIATDDLDANSSANQEEDFGTSWLVPGKGCQSECKLVHRPVKEWLIEAHSDKMCVTISPVTHCATGCKPSQVITSRRGYHCFDKMSPLATQIQQQMKNNQFNDVIKTMRNRRITRRDDTTVHVDCNCSCPTSAP